MRRRVPVLKWIALAFGGIFVLTGIAALVGDPSAAAPGRRTGLFVRALHGLREALGDPGAGIAMIVIGALIGSLLYWAAARP